MGQTNVLPDTRLPLRLLTPSGPIFHTVNRKYFARKKQNKTKTKKKKKKKEKKKKTPVKIEQIFKIAAKAVQRDRQTDRQTNFIYCRIDQIGNISPVGLVFRQTYV